MTFVETLPVLINILLCILLVVLIVLLIKCIIVVDKTDKLLDNLEKKVNTLNGFFNAIGAIDRSLVNAASLIFGGVENIVDRLFSKKESK